MIKLRLIAVAGAVCLAVTAVLARTAFAGAPITLKVAQGGGECVLTWKKEGVTFTPLAPGSTTSAFAVSGMEGALTVDLAAIDPVSLAGSVGLTATADAGFTFQDAAGHTLQASDPQGTYPNGILSFVVKTTADTAGTRIPVYTFSDPPPPSLSVTSLLPPHVTVKFTGTPTVMTSEFAQVLNTTFGPGSATAGAPFGTCNGQVVT